MNKETLINWFESRRGKLTYSMQGSRNGADGTADCSGSISQALKEAGAPIQGLPSTVTLPNQLQATGAVCVSRNEDWEAQRGDIVLMSWGVDMSQSAGAGGHVGAMLNDRDFISVDYSTNGQAGTAVSSHVWNDYYAYNQPAYIEVWRYPDEKPQPAPTAPQSTPASGTGFVADKLLIRFAEDLDPFKKDEIWLFQLDRGIYNHVKNAEELNFIRKQYPNIETIEVSRAYPAHIRYIEAWNLTNGDK